MTRYCGSYYGAKEKFALITICKRLSITYVYIYIYMYRTNFIVAEARHAVYVDDETSISLLFSFQTGVCVSKSYACIKHKKKCSSAGKLQNSKS